MVLLSLLLSNSQWKRYFRYSLSAIYARRPVVAKTAACYDAQYPSLPLLLQFLRGWRKKRLGNIVLIALNVTAERERDWVEKERRVGG